MSLVIDADGHVEETLPELVDAIPSAMRDSAMQFVAEAGGYVTYRIEGRLWRSKYPFPGGLQNHVSAGGVRREGGRDPKVRLQVLDDEGIDAAVLYPSVGLMFGLLEHPDIAAALCAAYNDWLARYCATDAKRLIGVALLPQHDPRLAAAELERAVTTHGFVGGVMRPNRIGGRTVDHPDFDVLWDKAQSSTSRCRCTRPTLPASTPSVLTGCPAMPAVTSSAMSSSRWPRWSTSPWPGSSNASHGCVWASSKPVAAGRRRGRTASKSTYELAPDDYRGGNPDGAINTRSWLTFEIEEPGLASTLEQGWADNVMFASDYPHHDAVYPGAVKCVKERGLGETLERKVLGDNALAFYGDRLRRILSA